MTEPLTNSLARLSTALVILGLTVVYCLPTAAQSTTRKTISAESGKDDDNREPFTRVEEELRAKRAIHAVDKEYQENLDRARNLSSLGCSVVTSYKQKNSLDREELKKLEKIEKLAKGIRRAAGGSEDDVEMEKPPRDIAAAIEMLSTLSESLKVKVEKTPKHVISAAVIDEANVLLELIRIVRTLPSKV